MPEAFSGLELRSQMRSEGFLELSLVRQAIAEPAEGEVVVRVDAAPINPADLLVMFGPAEMVSMKIEQRQGLPVATAGIPAEKLASVAARLDQSVRVGNEGAGVVVAAGPGAAGLLGRSVALRDGMFAQYRVARASDCLILPEGTAAKSGASASINPMTVLAMIDTMRREGHTALVHTAAASSVGQMLSRVCLMDGIPLINIVRTEAQVKLLRDAGAIHVVNSSSSDFLSQLVGAIAQTGATLAFDAIGGGTTASDILHAMEVAQTRNSREFNRYGSSVHKQVYIYGLLSPGDRVIRSNIGTAWGVGGWLMSWHLAKIGESAVAAMRSRVIAELETTFKSEYGGEIGLADMLTLAAIERYRTPLTGQKFLVIPNK